MTSQVQQPYASDSSDDEGTKDGGSTAAKGKTKKSSAPGHSRKDTIIDAKRGQVDPDTALRERLKKEFGQELKEVRVQGLREQLEKVAPAQSTAVAMVLKNDIYERKDKSEAQTKVIKRMKDLNNFNWQYFLIN